MTDPAVPVVPSVPVAPAQRPLAVFDVDGVLADVRHRLSFLDRRPKDWDGFFGAAPLDPPLADGVALARERARDCEVVYVTGRPERCRADTLAWFVRHGLPPGRLAMRGNRDRRPARQAKVDLLAALATDRIVAVVVDDDPTVCDAYAARGYPVVRATWMPTAENACQQGDLLAQAQDVEGRT